MGENVIIERNDVLERLLMSGDMESRVRKIIQKELKAAETRAEGGVRSAVPNDPREAYKAVRHAVYKRVLGGNLSILNKRKRSGAVAEVSASVRGRSGKTERSMSYSGEDRGFILRILNSGTRQRFVKTLYGREIVRKSVDERPNGRSYRGGIGNRGAITPRNFFGRVAQKELNEAAKRIGELIEEEINKVISKG